MNWKNIRLELARTKEFPEGSAIRAYLLRLPLGDDGKVDEAALLALPTWATVRRFWPNEPDICGYVIRTPKGWALSYKVGEDDDEVIFHLETHAIQTGQHITLPEPEGRQLPFRVASISDLGGFIAAA